MKTYTYDPAQNIINVGGRDIVGFADGTFIKVMRNVDAFSLVVGADGEATRVKSQNRSGRFEISLQVSSPSNDYLSSLAETDEKTSKGAVPVMVKENNGTSKASCAKGWVVKKPDMERGKESGSITWILETGSLDFALGGTNEL